MLSRVSFGGVSRLLTFREFDQGDEVQRKQELTEAPIHSRDAKECEGSFQDLFCEAAHLTGALRAAINSTKLFAATACSIASLRLNNSLASPSRSCCD